MNSVSEKLSSPVSAPFGYVALWSGSHKAKVSARNVEITITTLCRPTM